MGDVSCFAANGGCVEMSWLQASSPTDSGRQTELVCVRRGPHWLLSALRSHDRFGRWRSYPPAKGIRNGEGRATRQFFGLPAEAISISRAVRYSLHRARSPARVPRPAVFRTRRRQPVCAVLSSDICTAAHRRKGCCLLAEETRKKRGVRGTCVASVLFSSPPRSDQTHVCRAWSWPTLTGCNIAPTNRNDRSCLPRCSQQRPNMAAHRRIRNRTHDVVRLLASFGVRSAGQSSLPWRSVSSWPARTRERRPAPAPPPNARLVGGAGADSLDDIPAQVAARHRPPCSRYT